MLKVTLTSAFVAFAVLQIASGRYENESTRAKFETKLTGILFNALETNHGRTTFEVFRNLLIRYEFDCKRYAINKVTWSHSHDANEKVDAIEKYYDENRYRNFADRNTFTFTGSTDTVANRKKSAGAAKQTIVLCADMEAISAGKLPNFNSINPTASVNDGAAAEKTSNIHSNDNSDANNAGEGPTNGTADMKVLANDVAENKSFNSVPDEKVTVQTPDVKSNSADGGQTTNIYLPNPTANAEVVTGDAGGVPDNSTGDENSNNLIVNQKLTGASAGQIPNINSSANAGVISDPGQVPVIDSTAKVDNENAGLTDNSLTADVKDIGDSSGQTTADINLDNSTATKGINSDSAGETQEVNSNNSLTNEKVQGTDTEKTPEVISIGNEEINSVAESIPNSVDSN